MRGVVKEINYKNGMAAIEIDKNEFTILSGLNDADIMMGSKVSGDLRSLGFVQLRNDSLGRIFFCTIENFDCTETQLKDQLRI